MSRYTGPRYRKSRRLGFSTLENGKELAKKPFIPGQHGKSRRGKLTEYAVQLQEKQKVRFMYGLNERQFKNLFVKAGKINGVHGENFLMMLESRLDNLVYRMGFVTSRRASRQLVNHGHVLVNGSKVDIPSYIAKPGDVITLRERSQNLKVVAEAQEAIKSRVEFITFDAKKLTGTFVRLPQRSELSADINESLIVEYYNR